MIDDIAHQWAVCQYHLTQKTQQLNCFEKLVSDTNNQLNQTPDDPELMTMLAINKASFAGIKGGRAALALTREAKQLLDKVLATQPDTLNGAAYLTLGSLYYRLPGWPISFGNDKKARQLLEKAIALNPDNISFNYFYSDFLARQGDVALAIKHLKHAQQQPEDPRYPLAYQGRQQDISKLLSKLE